VLLGTDTGAGKSAVAVALLRLAHQRHFRLVPSKPVESGVPCGSDAEDASDAARLRTAARRGDLPLSEIRPFALEAPVAAAAATPEGDPIRLPSLLAAVARVARHGDAVLVETAGGVLSPYAPGLTSADLAQALGLPVLLVARNALGTINHTALAVAEIRRRALPLAGVLLVDTRSEMAPDRASNAALIATATGIRPLGPLPFVPGEDADHLAHELAVLPGVGDILATLGL
jgi:dethiobiotin synthetase